MCGSALPSVSLMNPGIYLDESCACPMRCFAWCADRLGDWWLGRSCSRTRWNRAARSNQVIGLRSVCRMRLLRVFLITGCWLLLDALLKSPHRSVLKLLPKFPLNFFEFGC
jgi:hypothetical protein